MMYSISYTSKFKTDYLRLKNKRIDCNKLKEVIKMLQKGISIVNTRNVQNCGILHIEPDWLLVFKYDIENNVLHLIRTGSHNELY